MIFRLVFILLALLLPYAVLHGEEIGRNFSIPSSRYDIIYGSPAWNTSPTKIDTAFLVIRDRISKKLLQVQLEEVAPDSAQFKGSFHFKLAQQKSIVPEVYIPPQSLRNEMDHFYQLVQQGKVARKPVIIKRTREENLIDVYDTKEQARRAWSLFKEKSSLRAQIPNSPLSVSQQDLLSDAEALAKKKEADREEERLRMEQIERQKIQDLLQEQQKLSLAERKKRESEAKKLAEEGMQAYQNQNYALAEEKFRQSAQLDPSNKDFYYRYGVSLYKNQKYNEALVALNIAPVASELKVEKEYYIGLSHFNLEEYKRALHFFNSVAESKDPVLAPSAEFYKGLIYLKQEKFAESKLAFETVIDTSQDPKLDEKAEEYIETVARAEKLAELRKKKWRLSATAGLMYDSNVLLAPDLQTSQGTSQEEGDIRLITSGNVTYKALLEERSSWDINASASLTNSSKSSLASADPWLYTLSAPYVRSWSGDRPRRLTLTPSYEILYMALSGNSTKNNIMNSYVGKADYLISNHATWFSNYNLELRQDDFSISSAVGDNDLDAFRYSFGTTQTALIGPKKKQALAGTLRYAKNQAKGKNRLYNRYEGAVTYAKPVWIDGSWTTSLTYYYLRYPDSSTDRKDNNMTISSSLAKPITDWFTWGLVGSFSNNVSTDSSSYSYERYSLMTTASFNTAF